VGDYIVSNHSLIWKNTLGTLLLRTAYIAFSDREYQRFVSRGDSFLLNFILNSIFNLALARRGINSIESGIDCKELIKHSTLKHSVYRVFRP
jgi:hypothetical protein